MDISHTESRTHTLVKSCMTDTISTKDINVKCTIVLFCVNKSLLAEPYYEYAVMRGASRDIRTFLTWYQRM